MVRFAAVYENFENDIYHALELALEQLSKYHNHKDHLSRKNSYYPERDIERLLSIFATNMLLTGKVVHNIEIIEQIAAS